MNFLISLPWYITRSAAITSYLLLFLICVLGTGMTTGFIYKFINPIRSWTIHKYLGMAFGVMVVVHASSLLFDNFISLGLADVLIPFYSKFQPLYLSFGILGFYLMLIILFTSIFLRVKTPKFWRATHYFVYPLFILGLFHGLFLGTDSATLFMKSLYWFTGIVFAWLLIYRFVLLRISDK